MSQATTLPTTLGGSKKMAALQNQINLGKENLILLQVIVSRLPFLLFPSLFEIIARSAHGSAIPHVRMYVGVVRKWLLCDFCTLGYCLVPKAVPNKHISPMPLPWG